MATLVDRAEDASVLSNYDMVGVAGANPPGPVEATDAITKRMVKSFLDLFVLEMLNNRPKHGYEIMKELESRVGTRVGPGTLYPLLYELESKELIVGEWVSARKTRKIYKITSMGESYMRESFRSVNILLDKVSGPLAWVKIH